jgi:outer membrane protein with beta-barrel domain
MRKLIPVAALALVAIGGEVSSAQTASPMKFSPSLYAGAAIPTGDLGDALNTGFTVGGGLDLHTGPSPLSWRGEVAYTRYTAKDDGSGFDEHFSDLSGRVNAVLGMPATGFAPYVIGGVGLYHLTASASGGGFTGSASDNKFGWNIGAGIDMPIGEIAGRLEVRYHRVSEDNGSYTYVPITFGIRF